MLAKMCTITECTNWQYRLHAVLGIHYKIAIACIKQGESSHLMQALPYHKSLPNLLLLRSATSPAFFLEIWLLTLELHVVVVLEELAPIACILLAA